MISAGSDSLTSWYAGAGNRMVRDNLMLAKDATTGALQIQFAVPGKYY